MLSLLNQPAQQSPEAVIVTLCDRLSHSQELEDRRAAALSLKSFSRTHRELVASTGLRSILETLERDSHDPSMSKILVEILVILSQAQDTSNSSHSRTKNKTYESPFLRKKGPSQSQEETDNISLWLTDELVHDSRALSVLFELLIESDSYTQLYSLQLISALVVARRDRAKQAIFAIPSGIDSIVKALDSGREFIRNEAILVLMDLTFEHTDFQKIVAFQDCFERLFNIIQDEGGILFGGSTVSDCINLMANLLEYNVPNQKLFRENQCVANYARLLEVEEDMDQWSEHAIINMTAFLNLACTFMTRDSENTPLNQNFFCHAGVLLSVLRLAFGPKTAQQVRVAALLTAGALIESNAAHQEQFLDVDVPYYDLSISLNVQRIPEIVPVSQALVGWCLTLSSTHMFDLRAASLRCLIASFKNNSKTMMQLAQAQIALYSNPTPCLISALADYDDNWRLNPLKPWFAAAITMHLFEGSTEIKDLFRSTTIGDTSLGQDEIPLMQAITGQLVAFLDYPDKVMALGHLMLLSVWLFDDLKAVNEFLKDSTIVHSLISHVTTNRDGTASALVESLAAILLGVTYDFTSTDSPMSRKDLFKLLTTTIGRDQYSLLIRRFHSSETLRDFAASSMFNAPISLSGLPAVYLEECFVDLFRENFGRIKRAIDKDPEIEPSSRVSLEMFDDLKAQLHVKELDYDALKRKYDVDIESRTSNEASLNADLQKARNALEEAQAELKDINERYKKDAGALHESQTSLTETKSKLDDIQKNHTALLEKVASLQSQLSSAQSNNKTQAAELESVKKARETAESGINKMNRELMAITRSQTSTEKELESTKRDLFSTQAENEELKREQRERSEKIASLKTELSAKEKKLKEKDAGVRKLESQMKEAESKVSNMEQLRSQLNNSTNETESLKEKLVIFETQKAGFEKEKKLMKDTIEKALNQKKALQTEKDSLEKRFSALNKQVNESTNKESFESQLKERDDKVVAVESQLKEKDEKITAIQSELKQKDKTVTAIQSELKQKDEKIKSLESKTKTTKSDNTELNKYKAELEEKSTALDELVALLEDLTEKKSLYKSKLRELDHEVSESEPDEDE